MKVEIKLIGKSSIYVTIDNCMYVSSLAQLLNIEPNILEDLYGKYTSNTISSLDTGKFYIFSNIIEAQSFVDDLEPYIIMGELK